MMKAVRFELVLSLLLLIPALGVAKINNPYSNPKLTSAKLFNNLYTELQIKKICQDNKAMGTQDYIACGKYDWEQADKKLDEAYKNALKHQNKQGEKKLKISQQQWAKYRFDFCDEGYIEMGGIDAASKGFGTDVPLEYMECMKDMANERTNFLLMEK